MTHDCPNIANIEGCGRDAPQCVLSTFVVAHTVLTTWGSSVTFIGTFADILQIFTTCSCITTVTTNENICRESPYSQYDEAVTSNRMQLSSTHVCQGSTSSSEAVPSSSSSSPVNAERGTAYNRMTGCKKRSIMNVSDRVGLASGSNTGGRPEVPHAPSTCASTAKRATEEEM
jgi:hypothetical protein